MVYLPAQENSREWRLSESCTRTHPRRSSYLEKNASQGNSLPNNMAKVYVLRPTVLSSLCDTMKDMEAGHERVLCVEL